jgi:hypothetical protein
MANFRHLGYFPFCVAENDDFEEGEDYGAGTNYPVGVPLEMAMKWYWKVKTWRISYSIEFVNPPEPLAVYSDEFVFANNGEFVFQTQVTEPELQKDLVCPLYTDVLRATPPPSPSSEFQMNLFQDSINGPILKIGELYYPQLLFNISIAEEAHTFTTIPPDTEDTYIESGIASIDGYTIPSFVLQAESPQEIKNCEFAMTVEEEWD